MVRKLKTRGIIVVVLTLTLAVCGMSWTVRNAKNPTGEKDQEGYILTNDKTHNEIHYANYFTASLYVAGSTALTTLNVAFLTGDKVINLQCSTYSQRIASFYFYEDAVTSGGTVGSANSTNSAVDVTSTATIWFHPTVSATGTTLTFAVVPALGTIRTVGRVRADDYFVLKKNTKYLFSGTAQGGQASDLEHFLMWYEK